MSVELQERLNQILPRITSDDFLSGAGIGNEIAFYIFDYPPEEELVVREHVRFLMEHIPKAKPELRVKHVNLFDFVLDYLHGRNLLDRSLQMQREKGDEALKKALRAALHENKLAQVFRGCRPAKAVRPCSGLRGRERLAAAAVPRPAEQPPPDHGRDAARDVLPRPIRRAVAQALRQAEEQQLLPGLQAGPVRAATMLIKNLFTRDIFRPINGVVKADQLDDFAVWQEFDEFVITKELDQHFRKFFSSYTEAIKNPNDPAMAGKIGRLDLGLLRLGQVALPQSAVLPAAETASMPTKGKPATPSSSSRTRSRTPCSSETSSGPSSSTAGCHPLQHRQQGRQPARA